MPYPADGKYASVSTELLAGLICRGSTGAVLRRKVVERRRIVGRPRRGCRGNVRSFPASRAAPSPCCRDAGGMDPEETEPAQDKEADLSARAEQADSHHPCRQRQRRRRNSRSGCGNASYPLCCCPSPGSDKDFSPARRRNRGVDPTCCISSSLEKSPPPHRRCRAHLPRSLLESRRGRNLRHKDRRGLQGVRSDRPCWSRVSQDQEPACSSPASPCSSPAPADQALPGT
eukprot:754862-Hanusia_phi.AAC.4